MPIYDAPPSTEGDAVCYTRQLFAGWQAMRDAMAFRRPYSEPPSDELVTRLLAMWDNLDNLPQAKSWITANLLNWTYRSLQASQGNSRNFSNELREAFCDLPWIDEPDHKYWEDLAIIHVLGAAYAECWTPATDDGASAVEGTGGRIKLAMAAVAEHLADVDGKPIGKNARTSRIKRARRRLQAHIATYPIIFSTDDDAFLSNPAVETLAKLPISRGRPTA
jgi:hypothetical protein